MDTETVRLLLRPPTRADVPALFEFLGDADAMRYTHCDASLRECRRRIVAHEWRRRRDGYAPWTVVSKGDSRIIGWGGLYNDPFDLRWGVEVGYFFRPEAWGQGYGSELMAACISLADDVLRLPEVKAFARAENLRSRRVLERAGFELIRFVPEMERLLYRRGRNDRLVRPSMRVLRNSCRPCGNALPGGDERQRGPRSLEQRHMISEML